MFKINSKNSNLWTYLIYPTSIKLYTPAKKPIKFFEGRRESARVANGDGHKFWERKKNLHQPRSVTT
ncbi:hypothetical protein L596_001034 [Steinernema carpocapsae]|uniref:Uncharacterized protein n=1 Tax=Steinernema carpocapsae TaxID=34508 RepID=A0A4U8UM72_STECR|nr:hypothetical protein L596_001034 [Steinernema carpocapsae]